MLLQIFNEQRTVSALTNYMSIIYALLIVVNFYLTFWMAGLERIELPPSVSKTEMISISPKPVDYLLAPRVGFEPT